MGTPVAVIWAMIYFHWHEKHNLIPSYGTKILSIVQFVDDIFGVAIVGKEDGLYASNTTWVETKEVPKIQGLDQSKLVPLLVKTILELEARITALENTSKLLVE